jgi:aryl-phospho-beta-D-glucosidase BglC (GH1 family)
VNDVDSNQIRDLLSAQQQFKRFKRAAIGDRVLQIRNHGSSNLDSFMNIPMTLWFLILLWMFGSTAVAEDSFEANQKLGRGVNFGNALEAPAEGDWGMELEARFFGLVKQAGFQSIRLPISWTHHAAKTRPYTINRKFFKRVDWAIGEARKRGLNLIVNVHHHDELNDNPLAEEARYLAIWKQIAERYKNQPGSVYFELLNEPHEKFNNDPELWNSLLAKALAVVRQSNPTRPVIVGPTGWNGIGQLPNLDLPEDPNLIVTVHFYDPFEFTHQGAEWVDPIPPTGITWDGGRRSFARGWEDWSWDTGNRFVGSGLEVRYRQGWAGLYLHHDTGVEGYDSLAFKTSRAMQLSISCAEGQSYGLTSAAGGLNQVTLAQCGNPAALIDLMIQNATDKAQQPFVISDLKLSKSGSDLSLFGNQLQKIRAALKAAADWGKANNRPIFLGEFGAYEKGDMASRVRWTTAVRRETEKLGLSWTYWEFGAGFGIYDRSTDQWSEPLLEALVP